VWSLKYGVRPPPRGRAGVCPNLFGDQNAPRLFHPGHREHPGIEQPDLINRIALDMPFHGKFAALVGENGEISLVAGACKPSQLAIFANRSVKQLPMCTGRLGWNKGMPERSSVVSGIDGSGGVFWL